MKSADPEVRGVTGVLWVLGVLVVLFTGHPRNLDSAEKSGVDEQHFGTVADTAADTVPDTIPV